MPIDGVCATQYSKQCHVSPLVATRARADDGIKQGHGAEMEGWHMMRWLMQELQSKSSTVEMILSGTLGVNAMLIMRACRMILRTTTSKEIFNRIDHKFDRAVF